MKGNKNVETVVNVSKKKRIVATIVFHILNTVNKQECGQFDSNKIQ